MGSHQIAGYPAPGDRGGYLVVPNQKPSAPEAWRSFWRLAKDDMPVEERARLLHYCLTAPIVFHGCNFHFTDEAARGLIQ